MSGIWYVYRRDTGAFAGSGTPKIETATHGSTDIPCAPGTNEQAVWNGKGWTIQPADNPAPWPLG